MVFILFLFINSHPLIPLGCSRFKIFIDIIGPETGCGSGFAAQLSIWPALTTCLGSYSFMRRVPWQSRSEGTHPSPVQTTADVLRFEGATWLVTYGYWFESPSKLLYVRWLNWKYLLQLLCTHLCMCGDIFLVVSEKHLLIYKSLGSICSWYRTKDFCVDL